MSDTSHKAKVFGTTHSEHEIFETFYTYVK